VAVGSSEGEILALWRAGRGDQAGDALVRAASTGRRLSLPEAEFLQIALHLERTGRYDGARVAFEAFLEAHPRGRGAPLAALGAGLILSRHDADPAGARPYLREALSSPYAEEAVRRAAREELDRVGDR
jgi:Flp pilus assembly protein TadD